MHIKIIWQPPGSWAEPFNYGEVYSDILPKPPRILDPANPFKNFYRQGLGEVEPSGGEDIKKRWEIFEKKIKTLNLVMNIT